jgi:hypothetical protein
MNQGPGNEDETGTCDANNRMDTRLAFYTGNNTLTPKYSLFWNNLPSWMI